MCASPRPAARRAALGLGGRIALVALAALVGACRRGDMGHDGARERIVAAPEPVAPTPTAPTAPGATVPDARPRPTDACPDPLAGRWHARRYANGEWLEHRVILTRRGRDLACAQEFRSWPGGLDDVAPPACPDGGRQFFQARLRCEATARAGSLELASVELLDRRTHCGGEVPTYNLDHFVGTLDGNQWDAINDDGGDDVGQPYRFRRVSCGP